MGTSRRGAPPAPVSTGPPKGARTADRGKLKIRKSQSDFKGAAGRIEASIAPQCTAMMLADRRRYDFVAHCTPPVGMSPMKSCLLKDESTSSWKELAAPAG